MENTSVQDYLDTEEYDLFIGELRKTGIQEYYVKLFVGIVASFKTYAHDTKICPICKQGVK